MEYLPILAAIILGALIAALVWWLRRMDQPPRTHPESEAPSNTKADGAQGVSAAFKKD